MPELPEVETVVRGLRAALRGRKIMSVRLGKTDFIRDPAALERELPGRRIARVTRYGKFLVLDLESPGNSAAALHLIVHLGMTGQFVTRVAAEPVPAHTHMIFALDDGCELRYTDIRRFGRVFLVTAAGRETLLGKLGADPMESEFEELRRRLAGRRGRVKALMLNQHVLRGLGNIYSDESLWRARVHPMRAAASLRREELDLLLRSIREILKEAIELRGSTVSDYVDANGQRGEFQLRHRVYQREGEKCLRCGTRVRRVIVAGRGSYFCPRCQRAPRKRNRKRVAANRSIRLRPTLQRNRAIQKTPTRLRAPA